MATSSSLILPPGDSSMLEFWREWFTLSFFDGLGVEEELLKDTVGGPPVEVISVGEDDTL
jgi:hypothetical protein